jgi:hypothetical protein
LDAGGAFAAGCGGGEQPAVGVADRVFKLEIDLDRLAQPACGDPSCVLVEHLEWVAPERGWWRRETEDGSGYRTTTVFAHGRYANNDEVRIGSPGFIGFLGRPRTDPLVKREVRGLKARAFGKPVTLANGEDALAYRRAMITESTFVTIAVDSPGVDLRRMASALRPL